MESTNIIVSKGQIVVNLQIVQATRDLSLSLSLSHLHAVVASMGEWILVGTDRQATGALLGT